MPIVRSLVCVRVTAECFRQERRIGPPLRSSDEPGRDEGTVPSIEPRNRVWLSRVAGTADQKANQAPGMSPVPRKGPRSTPPVKTGAARSSKTAVSAGTRPPDSPADHMGNR
jgi:hypothetical protein